MPVRLLLLALVLTAVVVGVGVAGVGVAGVGVVRSSGEVAPAATRPEVAAAALLRAWDERRAEAWASGEPARLQALYAPGSAAGRADRAMLRSWTARGLRIEGLRMQLLSVRVRAWQADRVVVVVTDRLVGGRVVGPGVSTPLPRDTVSTRTVALARAAGKWRVDAVSPAS